MKRIMLVLILLYSVFFCVAYSGRHAQEKLIRETYRKLEIYNAAAQIFQNEQTRRPFRAEANLVLNSVTFVRAMSAKF